MSFNKKTVEDIDVAGKRVLVRVDFNVPQDEGGRITDDRRIRAALPTIQYLVDHGARVILASHLGRPKGGPDPKYTLKPVAERLSQLLGKPVPLAPDSVGPDVQAMVNAPHELPGTIRLQSLGMTHSSGRPDPVSAPWEPTASRKDSL